MNPFLPILRRLGAAMIFAGSLLTLAARDKPETWEPVTPEALAAKPSPGAVEPGAEVLFSRMELDAFDGSTRIRHYRRIKIYEERAIEELGKQEFRMNWKEEIKMLAARIIHPDGTTADVPKVSIEENTLVRTQNEKWRMKRLVIPGLAAGDIVDVQWSTTDSGYYSASRFFFCQESIPVRKFEFQLGSYSAAMNLAWFRAPTAQFKKLSSQRSLLTITDLPAFRTEPDMPAPFDLRAAILLLYGEMPKEPEKVWEDEAEALWRSGNNRFSTGSAVRKAAQELAAGAGSEDEKLRRFYDFCQTAITNVEFDTSPASLEYREGHTFYEAGVILGKKRGTAFEINCLFASLCKAAGFPVAFVGSADRDDITNIHFSHGTFFLSGNMPAVKTTAGWRVFNPGLRPLPYGMARWENEGTDVLLADSRKANFIEVPKAAPEQSPLVRRGRLIVSAEGALEGDIEETLGGHHAVIWRSQHWDDTPDALEQAVRKRVSAAIPTAELDHITVGRLVESKEPLVLRYHLRIPDYVQDAGAQKIIRPGVFHQAATPRFTEAKREQSIVFNFAWQEKDEFEFQLPAGFELASPQAPAPVQAGDGLIREAVTMGYDAGGGRLRYTAEFSLGKGGATMFSASSYAGLKVLFERINAIQTHALVLRPKAVAATGKPAEGRP